jgi:hypothetical protein
MGTLAEPGIPSKLTDGDLRGHAGPGLGSLDGGVAGEATAGDGRAALGPVQRAGGAPSRNRLLGRGAHGRRHVEAGRRSHLGGGGLGGSRQGGGALGGADRGRDNQAGDKQQHGKPRHLPQSCW